MRRDDATWVKSRIKDRIQHCTPPDFHQPGQPHALLARLKLPIYLTTNYDDFLCAALRAENREVQREFSRWTADHHDTSSTSRYSTTASAHPPPNP